MLLPAILRQPKHGHGFLISCTNLRRVNTHHHHYRSRSFGVAWLSGRSQQYQQKQQQQQQQHQQESLRRSRRSGIWIRTYRTEARANANAKLSEDAEGEEADKRFKVLFMGRDEFSCLVLQQLYESKDVWKQIAIATQPDVHVGRRGSVLSISPLKTLGEKLDIPVYTIPKVKKEFKTWDLPPPFASPSPSPSSSTPSPSPTEDKNTPPPPPPPTHLLITASFGRILPNRMLTSFPRTQRLNVHPSLLPLYRGPAPIQWTVVNGDRESGVCVLEMLSFKQGIDAGGVWGCERVDVQAGVRFESLRDELAVLGGKLLVSVLRDLMNDRAICRPQAPIEDASRARAPMITSLDALVDFDTMDAEDVWRRFRGIGHQKPLYTYAPDGKALQLIELSPIPSPFPSSISTSLSSLPLPPHPGSTILDKHTDTLLVRCARGTVLGVRKVKPEGKGERRAGEWWTGLRAVKGKGSGGAGGVVLGRR